jgi:hypothetical protein
VRIGRMHSDMTRLRGNTGRKVNRSKRGGTRARAELCPAARAAGFARGCATAWQGARLPCPCAWRVASPMSHATHDDIVRLASQRDQGHRRGQAGGAIGSAWRRNEPSDHDSARGLVVSSRFGCLGAHIYDNLRECHGGRHSSPFLTSFLLNLSPVSLPLSRRPASRPPPMLMRPVPHCATECWRPRRAVANTVRPAAPTQPSTWAPSVNSHSQNTAHMRAGAKL